MSQEQIQNPYQDDFSQEKSSEQNSNNNSPYQDEDYQDEDELQKKLSSDNQIQNDEDQDLENQALFKVIQQQQNNQYLDCQYYNCSKKLKGKQSLKEHNNIHLGNKPYKCEKSNDCQKQFSQNSSLQKHLRTHTGEKPYQCNFDQCFLKFTQSSNLRRHEKIHTKEKPFNCSLCSKQFNTSTNLKQHQKTHNDNEQREKFMCDFDKCDKQYFYSCSLKKHLLEEHGICKKKKKLKKSESENFDYSIEILKKFFNNSHLIMSHQNHADILFNGHLYHYNNAQGKIEIHDLEPINEQFNCKPMSEITHQRSFKEYQDKIEYLQKNYGENILNRCNALTCQCKGSDGKCTNCNNDNNNCCGDSNIKEQENQSSSQKCCKLQQNLETCCEYVKLNEIEKEIKQCCNKNSEQTCKHENKIKNEDTNQHSCMCSKTQEIRHLHYDGCGHPQVRHKDHLDYIVENSLHHPHGSHCDYHGKVELQIQSLQ